MLASTPVRTPLDHILFAQQTGLEFQSYPWRTFLGKKKYIRFARVTRRQGKHDTHAMHIAATQKRFFAYLETPSMPDYVFLQILDQPPATIRYFLAGQVYRLLRGCSSDRKSVIELMLAVECTTL